MSSYILKIFRRCLKVNNSKLYQYPRRCSNIHNFFDTRFEKYRNTFTIYKFSQPLSINQKFLSTDSKINLKANRTISVEDLSSYYLNNGYINHNLYSKVIDNLNTINLTEEESNFLLESINYLYALSLSERMVNFEKLWDFFKKQNYITEEKVLIALKIFQQNKVTLDKVHIYLDNFEGLKLNLIIYEELIRLTCETGDIENATTEILDKMREQKLPLTNKIFNALILGHSRNGNIKNCEAVFDTMNAANLIPTSETYFELLRAYIENELEEEALTLLNKICNDLSVNQILMLLKSAASKKSINIIKNLTTILPEEFRNVSELPVSLKSMCIEQLFSNKIDSAFSILNSLPKTNFKDIQDEDKFGQFFISEMIRSEIYSNEKCLEICKQLIQSEKNPRALHIACEMFLRKYPNKADYFLRALSNLERLRPHYFWPLINNNFKKKGEKGILDILSLMSDLSVECDFETLYYHCFPHLSIILKNIEDVAKSFGRCGIKSSVFLTPLVLHLINQQRLNDVIKINNLYQTKIDTSILIQPLVNIAINAKYNKRYQQYSRLLKTLATKTENKNFDLVGQILIELLSNSKFNKDPYALSELINELALQQIQISKASFEFCKSHLSNFDKNEELNKILTNLKNMINKELISSNIESSDYAINHPRDMNLKELEYHLIELEEKKMNTRGVLRRLLQMYVKENQLENALKLKEKCNEQNVHVSAGMLASILDLHIKLKDLNAAKETIEDIKKKFPGFLIDEHKIIDLATLMVENDNLEEAQNLILNRAATTRTVGGEYIYKNLWNLLTQVAQFSARKYPDDLRNLTKEFFFMLKRYKFCQPQNALLGPIIREYLLKNKIKEAVQEFKYIVDNFKRTPLQLELMSKLVKINNSQNELNALNISQEEAKTFLQDIVTNASKIHGSINCNGTLLLAVAESGNETQLRKLLINPEFQLNVDALIKNIDYLSANGRIENILKLAKASRGIKHGLNEQELYTILLNEFVKKNCWEDAISLFNKLEADDELKISSEFVKVLIDLLKVNKINLPSNIALRAQIKI